MIDIKVDEYHNPANLRYKDKLVLGKDYWNDFGYQTLFTVHYFDKNGIKHKIGLLKIYTEKLDIENNQSTYYYLNSEIEYLDKNFCSLGQSINYYKKLIELFPEEYKEILTRLNDFAYNDIIYDEFKGNFGVQISLLRESSANKALSEFSQLNNESNFKKDLSFSYKSEAPYSEEETKIKINFQENDLFPNRINALVGKNGTGKTSILTEMANKLSGFTNNYTKLEKYFYGKRPPFEKIISISYSAFDNFKKNRAEDSLYSYAYCGIQSEKGTLSLKELRENFKKSLDIVKDKKRYEDWKDIIEELMEDEHRDIVLKIEREEFDDINWSSGQHIMISTITEVLANIEKESILLFDEPEIHLHPNAIANVMRMFNKLLRLYDSYAIFATHSPIILQELPSANIVVLNRIDNILTTRKPSIECFGESISSIISEVFDVSNSESNYKTILKNANKHLTEEEILNIFNNKLSLNARVYLKTIINRGRET